MTLQRALLALALVVLAAALIPSGILLERRLGAALETRARESLAAAPALLEDRMSSLTDVRMMHAREIARMPELAEAMSRGADSTATRIVSDVAAGFGERPILVGPTGTPLVSAVPLPDAVVDATRSGEMPVTVVADSVELHLVALAPVMAPGGWMGAAGGSTPFAADEVAELASLSRSDVVLVGPEGSVRAASLPDSVAAPVAAAWRGALPDDGPVRGISVLDRELLVAEGALDRGSVLFVRDLDEELAVLPVLRRTALVSAGIALVFALMVGGLAAMALARPVESLAAAADRFAAGDQAAPLVRSRVVEVQRVSDAFAAMRQTLAARLDELQTANRELEDRQERLALLQGELVQRERLAATGRLLAQLAHEIRNPVASVRNCLEVVRRSGGLGDEARAFADMAVDELLRMHELAERMLDLHRPRGERDETCDLGEVARETALLASAGGNGAAVSVVGGEGVRARIPSDALKQILLNLVLNAVEVTGNGAGVEIVVGRNDAGPRIEVLDRGPGIPEDALPRVFDPFFSTKDDVHGVGLGLFTAEGLVRTFGGRIAAGNRSDGPGARFVVDLPADEDAS